MLNGSTPVSDEIRSCRAYRPQRGNTSISSAIIQLRAADLGAFCLGVRFLRRIVEVCEKQKASQERPDGSNNCLSFLRGFGSGRLNGDARRLGNIMSS